MTSTIESIPVQTCMRRGCFRQLNMGEYQTDYCNAHQPQPEIAEPVDDDEEAIYALTPLGFMHMSAWCATHHICQPYPIIHGVIVQQRDTCTCGGWIPPDHWDLGVRECKACTERAAQERKASEEMEQQAKSLGSANRRSGQ